MYYFIVNPNACHGNGERLWKKVRRRLEHLGVEYEAILTESVGDARNIARQLTAGCRDPRVLIAVGGDGTLNEVVDGLVFESPITLGYISAGTGNDLARSLRLPGKWKRSLRHILSPSYYKMLDYGILSYTGEEPGHRRFMISCGIGMDAAVCHSVLDAERPECRKRYQPYMGRFVYACKGLRQLLCHVPTKGYLILDGTRKVEFNHIRFVSTHIHPYEGGGFFFAPKAGGDDGILEVCVIHGESRIGLIPMLLGAWLGRSPRNKNVRRYSCHELKIHVERAMPVHVDGESCGMKTDITLGCIAKKVRLIV